MSSWSMDRWLAVLGLGGTITGFVLSVWLWLKSRQEAIPRYKARTLELIAPLNQEYYFSSTDIPLRIQYEREASDRVFKLFVAFWNAGRRTLDPANAVGQAPFTIDLPAEAMIWGEPKVLTSTREEIQFEARKDPGGASRVVVTFLFLDSGDGGLIEILCAGHIDGYNIRGVFKGSRALQSRGQLGLKLVMPRRERILRSSPQFVTGGPDAWFLRTESALVVVLFVLSIIAGTLFGLVGALLLLVGILVFIGSAGGGGSLLKGSNRGLPKSLGKVPLSPNVKRSDSESAIWAFFEDLQWEVRRRRKGQLSPWEKARQKRSK